MSGKEIAESIKIREQIQAAIDAGNETPSSVLEWIEKHTVTGEDVPSLSTVSRIMREELGYEKIEPKWKKKGGK